MKKVLLVILSVLLVGCGSQPLEETIPEEQFEEQTTLNQFDINAYLEDIEPIVTQKDYIRLDSIFLDEEDQETVVITDQVVENILNVYNVFIRDHNTYEAINFFDLHIKRLDQLDIDILVFKIVDKIERDYLIIKDIVDQAQFKYITRDYNNRLTTTYLDNYEITDEALAMYPDLVFYIDQLNDIINGGYQIRKFGEDYHIFPDYASVLVRYDDYYGVETDTIVNLLVSNSRNIVKAGDTIQLDNEGIAYQINQIESFMKKYPNSVYYEMLRGIYQEYFITLITNPSNVEVLTSRVTKYQYNVVRDFRQITTRYSSTQLSRLLGQLVEAIDANADQYDQEIIDEIIEKIKASY